MQFGTTKIPVSIETISFETQMMGVKKEAEKKRASKIMSDQQTEAAVSNHHVDVQFHHARAELEPVAESKTLLKFANVSAVQ